MRYVFHKYDAVNGFFLHLPPGKMKWAFVGHSHVPQVYVQKDGKVEGGCINFTDESAPIPSFLRGKRIKGKGLKGSIDVQFDLAEYSSLIVVPSAGQPRDKDQGQDMLF